MAEFEFAGMTFRGGKMVGIIIALSTLIGTLYGAFEVYKDYMDMKEQIQNYVAPDLSEFDKKIAVMIQDMESLRTEMNVVKNSVVEASDYTRDIKNDLKNDIRRMEDVVEEIERSTKQSQREMDNDLREMKRQVDTDLNNIRTETEDKIQRALNNPLSVIAK
jgi:DNA anti-recombination protein RmuC